MLKEICRKHKTRTVQTLILHVILVLCVLSSCNYAHEEDNWMTTNAEKVDSIDFQKKHHYWKGFYFIATDSLRIASFCAPTDFHGRLDNPHRQKRRNYY